MKRSNRLAATQERIIDIQEPLYSLFQAIMTSDLSRSHICTIAEHKVAIFYFLPAPLNIDSKSILIAPHNCERATLVRLQSITNCDLSPSFPTISGFDTQYSDVETSTRRSAATASIREKALTSGFDAQSLMCSVRH